MRQGIVALSAALMAAALVLFVSLFLLFEVSPAGAQDSGGSETEPPISEEMSDELAALEEDFPPYSQVVDDATFDRFSAPGWEARSTNPDGYNGGYRVAGGAEPAQFKVEIPATGYYTVYAWWPTAADNSAAARFGVTTASGEVEWTEVNQQQDSGMWVSLGSYEMLAGDSYAVQVAAPESGGGGRVIADAVAVVRGVVAAPPDDGTIDVAGGKATGRDIVRTSRRHIGTKYVSSPPGRCRAFRAEDCSCHTKLVFKRFGWKLPDRGPDDQWRYGKRVARSDLRPGDLVFFGGGRKLGDHDLVSIYSGNGKVIFASHPRGGYGKVVEKPMKWLGNFFGAKRLNPR